MYEKVLQILDKYKAEVDNFNNAVFEDDFENIAEEVCKAIEDN
jgi:hypothetical protein